MQAVRLRGRRSCLLQQRIEPSREALGARSGKVPARDPPVDVRDRFDPSQRRDDDTLFVGDELEGPCGLGLGEENLQEAARVEIQRHVLGAAGVLPLAVALQEVIGARLGGLGPPESLQPGGMALGVESLSRGRSCRPIGKDARHRLRVSRHHDFAVMRKYALGLWPLEADVTHRHRRHRRR